MNIAVYVVEPRLAGIKVTEDEITAFLLDGRVVSVEGMLFGLPARRPAKMRGKSRGGKTH